MSSRRDQLLLLYPMHCTVDLNRIAELGLQLRSGIGADIANGPVMSLSGIAEQSIRHSNQTVLILVGRPRLSGTETLLGARDLLESYELHGDALLQHTHGPYALAVIDSDKKRVLLANDRMGRYGWCYRLVGGTLQFSDRADLLGQDSEIDPQAIFTYLFEHVIPSPSTLFAGVMRLPPASKFTWSVAGAEVAAHWRPTFTEPLSPDFPALRDEFRGLLRGAVSREWNEQRAMGRDGQTGTFLSGGTDSSTITGMLSEVAGRPIPAYSIGFKAAGYDEMEYAALAAQHFGVDHRQHYLTPDEVCEAMPEVATHYDQPFGNSSAVAAYHCARIARLEGQHHLLAGDGGDELFGGNARYAKQRIFGFYHAVPAALRHRLLEPMLGNSSFASKVPLLSKVASYVNQARVPMPDRLSMYNLLSRVGLDEMLTPEFRRAIDTSGPLIGHRAVYKSSTGADPINRMLAFDWKFTLADNDLPKVCGTAGLAGVSVGFPMLSDDLIDFSLKLPAHYKLNGLKLRWFFKEALRGFLPDEILAKRKQGFGLPFGVWALQNKNLCRLADDALAGFGTRGVVSPKFLSRLRQDLLPAHPGYYGELVWIIAMLELWLRQKAPAWRFSA